RPPGPPAARTDIRNFRAVSVSESEMQVTVDYTYAGDQGESAVTMGATPLLADGTPVPGLVTRPGGVNAGDGSATVGLRLERATGRYGSTMTKVCMRAGRAREFFCETFPHRKLWARSEPAPPEPEPAGRSGTVALNSRDSYHFRSGTRHKLQGGDFYFLDGKFWANNRQQKGVADLGNIGNVPLSQVDPARVRAYEKFGVPAVVGHTYVSPAREGEEGRFIAFRVTGSRGPAAVAIEYYYR
ncbi:MAG TPA: hypothetical protein VFX28_02045, partial [Methylomirabilota bacterium]|nr:hypothetical protein [Methylomirabilota bacterium]